MKSYCTQNNGDCETCAPVLDLMKRLGGLTHKETVKALQELNPEGRGRKPVQAGMRRTR